MQVPLFDLKAQHTSIHDELRSAVERVFETQRFVLGDEVKSLEEEVARYSQTRYAVGCASGSDALLLALMSLGVGPGDEVITSPHTFFATGSAIARVGARPVFVDIDERTYNIDPRLVSEAITDRTRAIVPVHIYGQCADMNALLKLAEPHGIPIIEDAAQAIGAEDRNRRAGSMGTIGCYSFYPSKNLGGAGDGGIVVTNDPEHAERLAMLRVHGEDRKYYHKVVGINSRLDELQAAVLRVKLPHLEEWIIARQQVADRYKSKLAGAGLSAQIEAPFVRDEARHVYHLFVIRVRHGKRDALLEHLHKSGVGSGVYYPVPLHLQECFAYLGYRQGQFPNAEAVANETTALPMFPEVTEEQQDYVVNTIAEFFARGN
jgi:dTDP-4-amino-4,6-dideoxygalactose transaminase